MKNIYEVVDNIIVADITATNICGNGGTKHLDDKIIKIKSDSGFSKYKLVTGEITERTELEVESYVNDPDLENYKASELDRVRQIISFNWVNSIKNANQIQGDWILLKTDSLTWDTKQKTDDAIAVFINALYA